VAEDQQTERWTIYVCPANGHVFTSREGKDMGVVHCPWCANVSDPANLSEPVKVVPAQIAERLAEALDKALWAMAEDNPAAGRGEVVMDGFALLMELGYTNADLRAGSSKEGQ
jgi:hypothetical protein